jgi:hypothetical protein
MLLPLRGTSRFIRGGIPRIDWSNPITNGLTGLWLPGLGAPVAGALSSVGPGKASMLNLVTGQTATILNNTTYSDSAPVQFTASSIGRGVNPKFNTYYWVLARSADLYGSAATFGITRRFTNFTLDQTANAFGEVGGISCYLPYIDSNIYWDFPNSSSRIGPFAYTMTNKLENWIFTGGPAGRSVWRDGNRDYKDTTTTTAGSPGSSMFLMNSGAVVQNGYTNMEYYVLASWARQTTDFESESWTLDPLQFLIWPEDDLLAELFGTGFVQPIYAPAGWFDPEFTNRGGFDPLMASTNLGLFDEEQGNNITGLGPSFYDDADSFSTQVVSPGPVSITPGLYNDADSFFTQVVTSLVTLTPGFYSDADSFFTQTVTPGSVSITPSFYSDADSFFTQVVALAPYNLLPPFYSDADTFYTPAVTQAGTNILPGFYSDADSFFTQVVSLPPYNLTPPFFSDADTFNTQVVSSVYALQPAFYNDADSFFTQIVAATYTLSPALYSDADTFNTQVVNSTYSLTPALFSDTDSFYSAIVSQGGIIIAPNIYSDADSYFSPTVTNQNNIAPGFYSDADTFYTQLLTNVNVILPAFYSDADLFYSPIVVSQPVNLSVSFYSDADTFFSQVVASITNLLPQLFGDGDTFYSPNIVTRQELLPSLYSDLDVYYQATLSFNIQNLRPAFFHDIDVFYSPVVYGGDVPRTIVVAPANRTIVSLGGGRTIKWTPIV